MDKQVSGITYKWLMPVGGPWWNMDDLMTAIDSCNDMQNVVVVDDTPEQGLAAWGEKVGLYDVPSTGGKGNKGCAAALNVGWRYIAEKYPDTEWLFRIDADDRVYHPHRRLWHCERADAQVAVICGEMVAYWPQTPDQLHLMRLKWSEHGDARSLLNEGRNPIHHPATCIRLSRLRDCGGYDEDVGRYEDRDLWFRIGATLQAVHETWTIYRLRERK